MMNQWGKLLCLLMAGAMAATAGCAGKDPLEELEESVTCTDGTLQFVLPAGWDGKWDIQAAGRMEAGDMSMSVHYFQEENEADEWKGGETYSAELPYGLTELYLEVSLDGTDRQTVIDLSDSIPAPEGFTDAELIQMAGAYYSAHHDGFLPPVIQIDGVSEDGRTVNIHLFELNDIATATYDWYEVDRLTGKGTNVTMDPIDLTEK